VRLQLFNFLDIVHQSKIENTIIIAHHDGTKDNINAFGIVNLPGDDQKCQGILNYIGNVNDFRIASKEYYNKQKERFPPSLNLEEGATKTIW